jgi:hypothetical protein
MVVGGLDPAVRQQTESGKHEGGGTRRRHPNLPASSSMAGGGSLTDRGRWGAQPGGFGSDLVSPAATSSDGPAHGRRRSAKVVNTRQQRRQWLTVVKQRRPHVDTQWLWLSVRRGNDGGAVGPA